MNLNNLPAEVKYQFMSMDATLSPENLTCDGELSKAKVRSRYNNIMKNWKRLCKEHNVTLEPGGTWDLKWDFQKIKAELVKQGWSNTDFFTKYRY